jgi:hypothetical protein
MVPGIGLLLRHQVRMTASIQQVPRHEDDEDGVQAVVAEALGRFIANNVRDTWRHPVGLDRRRKILRLGHAGATFAKFARNRQKRFAPVAWKEESKDIVATGR